MALEPQPDQRLDELMGTKQRGDPRQRDELAAPADMADSIDADYAYQQAAADVRLRREAHAGFLSGWGRVAGRGGRARPGSGPVRACVPSMNARAR
jgi:hypothetical protein